MTHKCCYFKVLQCLTSPLLAECDSKIVTDNSSNTYSKSWYSPFILHLEVRPLMVGSFTLWPLYSLYLVNRRLCGLHRPWVVWQRCATCRQWAAVSRWPVPDMNCNVIQLNKNALNLIHGEMEQWRSSRCLRSNERFTVQREVWSGVKIFWSVNNKLPYLRTALHFVAQNCPRQNIFWANFSDRTAYENKQVYLPPVWLFYTEREEKLICIYLTAWLHHVNW
jgi:hypothetical protein